MHRCLAGPIARTKETLCPLPPSALGVIRMLFTNYSGRVQRSSGQPAATILLERRSARSINLALAAAGYFFLVPDSGCHAPIVRLGAAAITLGFSFLGFLASRLPLCWPLAMTSSLCSRNLAQSGAGRCRLVRPTPATACSSSAKSRPIGVEPIRSRYPRMEAIARIKTPRQRHFRLSNKLP